MRRGWHRASVIVINEMGGPKAADEAPLAYWHAVNEYLTDLRIMGMIDDRVNMNDAVVKAIKDRVSKTICETWLSDHYDDNGYRVSIIAGRILADDFMVLLAEIDRLKKLAFELADDI